LEEIRLDPPGDRSLSVAALSDVGCVRANNEDAHGVYLGNDPERGSLLVVADGMGGAAAGEVASGLAVRTVADAYRDRASGGDPEQALQAALTGANRAIWERAAESPELGGMGTTCTAVAVVGSRACFAHVGDSRAYLLVDGTLTQLTADHSLAAEYARQGGVGGAPARARNVLTRCLGVKPEVRIDVSAGLIPLPDECTLLLCSDGLTNQVQEGELLELASAHGPEGACRRLVRLARDRGAPDNVTVVIARISRTGSGADGGASG
jgi:PPM family protein phosphatase